MLNQKKFFLNKIKGKAPMQKTIYPETVNKNDLCYQCSIYGSDLLFCDLRIRNKKTRTIYSHQK